GPSLPALPSRPPPGLGCGGAAALARGELLDLLVLGRRLGGRLLGRRLDARLLADLVFDLARKRGALLEELAAVVLALPQAVAVVDVPGARLLEPAVLHAELEDLALARDALAVHDIELRVAERRRHLVLHHLDAGFGADHLVALLDGADAADVHAHGRIEL